MSIHGKGYWALALLLPAVALARGGATENAHSLATAAGIASPSMSNDGSLENPVGYAYNASGKLQLYGSAPGTPLDSYNLGGQLLFGKGYVGGALGYRHSTTPGSNTSYVTGGLSAIVRGPEIGLGLSGLVRAGGTQGSSADMNLGMLFNPYGKIRIGATAYSLMGGIDYYGVGVAFAPNPQFTLSIDAAANGSLKGLGLQPGLSIHLTNLQLSASYGLHLDKSVGSPIDNELSAGIGAWLTHALLLQFYYQHASKYFVGIELRT